MIELPKPALEAIGAVQSKEDYDNQMTKFMLSPAPQEIKDEAIRMLRATNPQFDTSDKSPSAELDKQIKEGQSDLSDMGLSKHD
jgi:hypothetical protein